MGKLFKKTKGMLKQSRKGRKEDQKDGFPLSVLASLREISTKKPCCDARGLGPDDLTEGVEMGSLQLQADWTVEADKVLVF